MFGKSEKIDYNNSQVNESSGRGFIWGIVVGILGLLLFPFLKKTLKDLGLLVLKEGFDLTEPKIEPKPLVEEVEVLRERLKSLESQLKEQQKGKKEMSG